MRDVKYPEITVKLVGEDGNAFAIIGACRRAMKKHKLPANEIKVFSQEAMSGDYDHLLRTVCDWFSVK